MVDKKLGIDLDAPGGVMMKKHTATAMQVYMYLREKGVYRNAFGTEVPVAVAEAAGYDVKLFAKDKLKREKLALVMDRIDAEVNMELDPTAEIVILAERGPYKVIKVGTLGYANVKDGDGVLTPTPLPEAAALALLDQLAPPPVAEPEPEPEKKPLQGGAKLAHEEKLAREAAKAAFPAVTE